MTYTTGLPRTRPKAQNILPHPIKNSCQMMRTTRKRSERRNHTLQTHHKKYTAKQQIIIHDLSPSGKPAALKPVPMNQQPQQHTSKTN